MNNFTITQKDVHSNSVDKGFWDGQLHPSHPRTPVNDEVIGLKLALIHSEVSEALEAIRHGNPADKHLPHRGSLEVELADAVIRIMDLAEACGVDLFATIIEKHQFNLTRPHKHGKEF